MEKSNKVLTGCGIGCGAFTLIIVILAVVVYTYIADKVEIVKQMESEMAMLEEELGEFDDFCPSPDLSIDKQRIETFLVIRDSLYEPFRKFETSVENVTLDIEKIDSGEEKESFWSVLGIVSSGIGIIPDMLDYYKIRNELLFKYRMGFGEYCYYYTLAYYSWLKKSPGDGPDFPIADNEKDGDIKINFEEEGQNNFDEFSEEVKTNREEFLREKANYLMKVLLQNILDYSATELTAAIKTQIEKEIELLENNRYRIIWQDGLPGQILASFENYQQEFENTYYPISNPLELEMIKKEKSRKK